MTKKYELTDEFIEEDGVKLYRIRSLQYFDVIEKGELGGYVQSEKNLSQDGECWVSDDAKVYHRAKVSDDAKVHGYARVYGGAEVWGNAWVFGHALVYDDAEVWGNAWVFGHALVYDDAEVNGNGWVWENARVYGNAQVYGDARVSGEAEVENGGYVSGNAWIFGDADIRHESVSGVYRQSKSNTKLIYEMEAILEHERIDNLNKDNKDNIDYSWKPISTLPIDICVWLYLNNNEVHLGYANSKFIIDNKICSPVEWQPLKKPKYIKKEKQNG